MNGELIKKAIIKETGIENVQLSPTLNPKHGDYSTNIAMHSGQNPLHFANKLVNKLQKASELNKIVKKIEVAGPGFINFYLADSYIKEKINSALSENYNFGKNKTGEQKKVIVEYSSPNIAKPFTIGHFRSTIIGDSVANLLESQGFNVFRDNHLGDWGTQFGKQIYAIKEWGNEEQIEKSENPVKELVSLYVKFHKEAEKNPPIEEEARLWFKKLEGGDSEARRIWQKCITWSWKEFEGVYKRLKVTFTENKGMGYGESFFENKMQKVIEELKESNLLKNGEAGAQLVFFENDKFPPLMILKKDGATLYATRDLATDKWRIENYGKDATIINEVGGEQTLYFNQLFEVEKLLGWVKEGQRIHIKHGLFRFKDKKMSTRKGNVVWLKDVLDEAHKKSLELGQANKEIAETVAIGALKWNELKRDSKSDIVFDWNEILNMKGNSGPYLQYTVVRINSLIAKYNKEIKPVQSIEEPLRNIANEVTRFPEVVSFAGAKYQPSYLAEYLYNLASEYNTFYDTNRILESTSEANYVSTSKVVAITLTNGLNLLGISIPERM